MKSIHRYIAPFVTVLVASIVSACATAPKNTDLKQLYDRAAQYHAPDRNPIIVIPGILGSKLKLDENDAVIWGAFDSHSVDPNTDEGAPLIALPIRNIGTGGRLAELVDNVTPNGVLDTVKVKLFGIPLNIKAYAGILATLGAGGYRDENLGLAGVDYGGEHFTCFQFDYDWRRDNVENAKRLQEFIAEKRLYVQKVYADKYNTPNAEVKFDIVAHSMGGLVTRYFLRYGSQALPSDGSMPVLNWAGAQDVERVVLVGTPSAGSAEAFSQLNVGFDVAAPILPHYPSGLLGTFPSIYELLPRPRHRNIRYSDSDTTETLDLYDPDLWIKHQWGLADQSKDVDLFLSRILPKVKTVEERRKFGISFLKMVLPHAKQFHQAIDIKAKTPKGLDITLIAGDVEDTMETILINRKTGEFEEIGFGIGDGTVLRSSALMDERVGNEWSARLQTPIDWKNTIFLPSDHIGLTKSDTFSDNVLYWLLEEPRD